MAQITNSFPFQFYGTTIEVHMADDGHWYIRLDHMCEHLGLDSNSQRRRLQEHPAIGDRCIPIVIDTPYRDSIRKQEVWFLDIHVLHLWLGMIQVLKVREELRERLIRYQRDLAQSLWLLYRSETFPKEILDEINASMSPADRQVAEIFEAAQQLRRKVDILNGHLDEELSRLGLVIGDLDNRLGAVETKIIGEETIHSQQAKQIQDMVSFVADALHLANKSKYSKSTAHAAVHNEFKQQFQIHVYSALPASRFDDARTFLASWWQKLSKRGAPLPSIFRGRQDSLL
jgi:antirepressor protein/ORF6C domain-containing protein